MTDETLLLDLLNSTPAGVDDLAESDAARAWLETRDQPTGDAEWRALIEARDTLQDVVRGDRPAAALARFVDGVCNEAAWDDGVTWRLALPEGRSAAARVVLAWDALRVSAPGRLRPCANEECRLFLIDHSKPNRARWCSMAVCGNRMKARRHYQRTRQAAD